MSADPHDSADALNDLPLGPVSKVLRGAEAKDIVRLARRRADIDSRQEKLGRILEELGCEGAVLLVPAHVNWFTGGLNLRGLMAESERPGVYTNGRQRWLLCSVTDSQRLFDEDLDGLGFQVKEWQWAVGRAVLLGELVLGKKFAVDRPFPGLPLLNEKLRNELRTLSAFEQEEYASLGKLVAHALEATARTMPEALNEEEVAGQLAHRLLHRGVELAAVSIAADDRAVNYRRAGFSKKPVEQICTLQATGTRNGLYCTASRTVCFGPCPAEFRQEYDAACKLSAVYRAMSTVGETAGKAVESAWRLLSHTAYEYEGRYAQPGYATGRVPAEELRRGGHDEVFAEAMALTWQARVARAAVVDTVIVGEQYPTTVTPPENWPFKRITVKGVAMDIPDLLVRS